MNEYTVHDAHREKGQKSSLKRSSDTLDDSENRPSKKKRAASICHDNMDWLKGEISGINGGIGRIEGILKDMNDKLEDILYAVA